LISAIIGLSNLAFEKKQYRVIEGLGATLILIRLFNYCEVITQLLK